MKLSDIKGLGPKTLDCLKNLDINTVDDLVPYTDMPTLQAGTKLVHEG